MNVQGGYRSNLPIRAWEANGKVYLELGDGFAAMSPAEAREMASALTTAAKKAEPLVSLEGLQSANEDLVSEHATAGQPT